VNFGTVLVVEDEPAIRRYLAGVLEAQGSRVRTADSGEAALETLGESSVDIALVDLGLPGIDGLTLIRRIRTWSSVPIVVLTSSDTVEDKVTALDAGADDYLTKPFAEEELVARMRALLRRAAKEDHDPTLRFGELEIDSSRHLVHKDGELLPLTPKEYDLLEAMARNSGKLLTHQWLLQKVWGVGYATESTYLRVYMRQLRRKLGDDSDRPRWIKTETGLGYRWIPPLEK
jgi:two-component system KDP operon response regulator KdpE